jgi:hypothetical protein
MILSLMVNGYKVVQKSYGGDRIWNFNIKPTDGAVMCANLRKCVKWVRYDKINGGEEIWTLVYGVGAQSSANFQYMKIFKKSKVPKLNRSETGKLQFCS